MLGIISCAIQCTLVAYLFYMVVLSINAIPLICSSHSSYSLFFHFLSFFFSFFILLIKVMTVIFGKPEHSRWMCKGQSNRLLCGLYRDRIKWPESPLKQTLKWSSTLSWDGLPRWFTGKESTCQCRRHGFNPWIRKIPWKRKWQPTPVFLPRRFHEQRSLAGYSPWGHKELDMA